MRAPHVPAVGGHLPAPAHHLRQELRIALGNDPVHAAGRRQLQPVERGHDPEDADAVSVVAMAVAAVVRVRLVRRPDRRERRRGHVQREPLDVGMTISATRLPPGQDTGGRAGKRRPRVPVVIHARATMRVGEVVGRKGHGRDSCGPGRVARQGERPRLVVRGVVPVGDLRAGGEPDAGVRLDVRERPVERVDPMGAPGLERMERDAHHPSRFGPLEVELVELGPEDVAVLARRGEAPPVGRAVIGLERVRQADQPAARHVDRERLIVVEQVAHVAHAVLGEQTDGPLGVRQGRREPPGEALARVPEHGRDHVLDHRPLLAPRHAEEVARVVDAVGEKLPSRRAARLDDLRVMLAERDVERDAAADPVRARARRVSARCRRGCRSRGKSRPPRRAGPGATRAGPDSPGAGARRTRRSAPPRRRCARRRARSASAGR